MFAKFCRHFLIVMLVIPSICLANEPIKFDNITILVSSCDKYSRLWEPFFGFLFKEWPSLLQENSQIPIILIANQKSYPNPRVNTINIVHETSWSDNMLQALAKVNTKYVLILLDDYWLNAPVNEPRLQELFLAMQQERAAFLQISVNDARYQIGTPHSQVPHLQFTDKFGHYKTTLQAAIWDKDALQCLLRPGENPWEFELAGNARSHGYPQPFLSLNGNEPIHYLNAAQQGHINPAAIAYAEQQNMPFDRGNLPLLKKFTWKLAYQKWKNRAVKYWQFAQNPGLYYKSGR